MLCSAIELDACAARSPCPVVQARLTARVIEQIGTSSFGHGVLAAVNLAVPACEWTSYVLRRGAAPTLYAAACFDREEFVTDAWARYSTALHDQDAGFSRLWTAATPSTWWSLHCRETDLSERHRAELYRPQRLKERLSMVQRRGDELWALNLYRDAAQADFSEGDLAWLHAVGGTLFGCIDKHVQWRRPHDPWGPMCPDMTARERQVCDRLLKGWTHDGIAADLGVAARTVKTYRDRAFSRLGIHHRHQLFALVDQREGRRALPMG